MDKLIAGLTILATLGAVAVLAQAAGQTALRIVGYACFALAMVGGLGLSSWGAFETWGPKAIQPYAYLELECHAGLDSTVVPKHEFFFDVKFGHFYEMFGHSYGIKLKRMTYADCALSNTGDLSATSVTIPVAYVVRPSNFNKSVGESDFTNDAIMIPEVNHGSTVPFRIINDWSKTVITVWPTAALRCVVPPDLKPASCPVPYNEEALPMIGLFPLSPKKKLGTIESGY